MAVAIGAGVMMGVPGRGAAQRADSADAASEAAGAVPPYADTTAFVEREVTIGAAPFVLPGTLTLPRGARAPGGVPVLVLVHGSGPNDRDGTVGVKTPLRDVAWGLASRGIAVLRYDKRTRLHAAQMDLTTVTIEEETVADALLALEVARAQPEVDTARVFVLGHSLGGMIAPEIARRDGRLAGAVMMAAGARPLAEMMLAQLAYVAQTPENQVPLAVAQIAALRARIEKIARHEAAPDDMGVGAPARYFYDLDERAAPAQAAAVDVPLLVLQGERDYQVTMEDFAVWQAMFAERDDVVLRSYPGLDHLFVAGQGPSTPLEVMTAPGHVAEGVIADIAAFVAEH